MNEHTEQEIRERVQREGLTLAIFADLSNQFGRRVEVWVYRGAVSREGQPLVTFVREGEKLREVGLDRQAPHLAVLLLAAAVRSVGRPAPAALQQPAPFEQLDIEEQAAEPSAAEQQAAEAIEQANQFFAEEAKARADEAAQEERERIEREQAEAAELAREAETFEVNMRAVEVDSAPPIEPSE